MPEDKKPAETKPETPAEPPKQEISNEQVLAAVREANYRAMAAERRALLLDEERVRREDTRPQAPDPLDKYSQEDIVMSPDEKKRALSAAISGRAEEAVNRMRMEMDQKMAMRDHAMEGKVALDMVMATRPELSDPKNAPDFAASLTKAKYEADAAGIQLSPGQLTRKAAEIYDSTFRKDRQPVPTPYVEGMSRPDLSQPIQGLEVVTSQSMLEKQYGQKKGTIREMYNPNDPNQMDALNLEYIRAKNQPLLKKGVVTNLDTIRFQSEDPAVGQ